VKLHPHLGSYHILDSELSRLIEKEIAPRDLTILSHVGNDAPNVQPPDFVRLAARFPQTRFVAAHLANGIHGGSNSGINAWREFEPTNVWLDMATLRVMHTDILKEYVEVVGRTVSALVPMLRSIGRPLLFEYWKRPNSKLKFRRRLHGRTPRRRFQG